MPDRVRRNFYLWANNCYRNYNATLKHECVQFCVIFSPPKLSFIHWNYNEQHHLWLTSRVTLGIMRTTASRKQLRYASFTKVGLAHLSPGHQASLYYPQCNGSFRVKIGLVTLVRTHNPPWSHGHVRFAKFKWTNECTAKNAVTKNVQVHRNLHEWKSWKTEFTFKICASLTCYILVMQALLWSHLH